MRSAAFLGLAPLAACVFACSASAETEPRSAQPSAPATSPPEETGISAPADECVEETRGPQERRERFRLDEATRTVTQTETATGHFLVWRYDAAKLLVRYVGFRRGTDVTGNNPFQSDSFFDEGGQRTESRSSYPTEPNLEAPSTAPTWIGWRATVTYAPSGALANASVSRFGDSGTSGTETFVFRENEAGQCVAIETHGADNVVRIETRSYDPAGRLERIDLAGDEHECRPGSKRVRRFTYDEQGRMTQDRFWCDRSDLTARPDRYRYVTHRADGSQRIESVSYITDMARGAPWVIERSAYCAKIDAWRGGDWREIRPTTTRCTL